ncbi:hypothetical protein [Cronobacter malonaticus]|uniref:hypothetical protein n=1 Tax=Cronobacter malonaticus TaxID=413503 RepID=UPI0029373256|nr:hypothetical protein [Cronobacter malonaticus]
MSEINELNIRAVSELKPGYKLGAADVALLQSMARELLALRERAVPEGYRKTFTCSSCGAEGLDEPLESRCHCNGDDAHWIEGRLYTAPPAPVVPDALANDIDSNDHPLLWSYNNGWNACRAAMLAAPGKN